MMKQKWKLFILLIPILWCVGLISAQAGPGTSLALACSELPFNSFPPNQLLRQEENDGSAVSLLHAGRVGVWGEYFIQVDQPGTYLFSITGLKGPDKGICQAVADGNPVGHPIDLYDATDGKVLETAVGEEGRIDLSQDLHAWVKAGRADLVGRPDWWCNAHECSGDIFVDADHNIRYESQAGVINGKQVIVGNRLCTLVEGVLSGTDPTKVLWRSDLPWLPDWYGDAKTASPEDFTASNGSVFPGQTVIKDGWLWHFSGGNNTFTVLSKCWYGPLFECRNLQTTVDASHQCAVSVTVRNIGSLAGSGKENLTLDGHAVTEQQVSLNRDEEKTLQWNFPLPSGIHTVAVDDVSMSVSY